MHKKLKRKQLYAHISNFIIFELEMKNRVRFLSFKIKIRMCIMFHIYTNTMCKYSIIS